jgi:hypothetical protein
LNPGWQTIEVPCVTVNNAYDQLLVRINIGASSNDDSNAACVIDDIQLEKEPTFTEPTATITNITGDLCSGDALSVTYEICSDEDVILDFAPFASPASISVIPPSQSAGVGAGECKAFTFTYNENTELPLGTSLSLGLDYEVEYKASLCSHTSMGTISQSLEKYCFAEEACLPDGQPFYALSGGNFSALLSEGLLPPAQAATTPQFLYFEGDAVVDFASYTFSPGSILYFDAGVKISVPGTHSLQIYKSTLSGCTEMWAGIEVHDDGVLNCLSSTIRDAQYAVSLGNNSEIDIRGNRFFDNYIGIYKPPTFVLESVEQNGQPLEGNRFETVDGLKPGFLGQLPTPGPNGRAGILIYDCKILYIGTDGTSNNHAPLNWFENLEIGILAYRSGIDVRRASFYQMIGDFDVTITNNPPLEGIGIAMFGGTNLFASYNRFEAMERGMHLQNPKSALPIVLSQFESVQDAIVVNSPSNGIGLNINSNTISFRQFGIAVIDGPSLISGSISYNNINLGSTGSTYNSMAGILLSNISPAIELGNSLEVSFNIVGLEDIGNGIIAEESNAFQIAWNQVNFGGDINFVKIREGITLANTRDIGVFNNTLKDTNQGDMDTRGISVRYGETTTLCCNYTEGHTTGVNFHGLSTNSHFRQNTLTGHETGLRYSPIGVTGPQKHAGNRWLGSFSDAGARHMGPVNIVQLSIYDLRDPSTPSLPLGLWPANIIVTNGSPGDWFKIPPTGTEAASCFTDEECEDGILPPVRFTSLDSVIAESGFQDPALNWRSRQQLYHKTNAHYETLPANDLFDDFQSDEAGEALGQLESVAQGIRNLGQADSLTAVALLETQHQIAAYQWDMALLDSALIAASNAQDSAALWALRQEAASGVSALTDSLVSLQQEADSLRKAAAAVLFDENDAVAPDNTFAEKEQMVNAIYLNHIADGANAFLPESRERLLQIANGCPEEGGRAVVFARSLLMKERSLAFDDQQLCSGEQGLQALPNSSGMSSAKLTIVPNPARGITQVVWAEQIPAEQLKVFSIDGRLQLTQAIEGALGQSEVDASFWPSGLYIVRLHLQDGTVRTGKLIK